MVGMRGRFPAASGDSRFVPGTAAGYSAVVFYLIAYLFMNLGAFGVVVALANRGQDCEHMSSFAGLAQRRPGLAALMTLFMIALAGIPGTAGFTGKFLIFSAAVEAGQVWLAILGHISFALRDPVALRGMAKGTVPVRWARDTHPRWYQREIARATRSEPRSG